MSSLLKRESMGTKLVEFFTNMVVERSMITSTYGGELALKILVGV
jgi:hypothetical protein